MLLVSQEHDDDDEKLVRLRALGNRTGKVGSTYKYVCKQTFRELHVAHLISRILESPILNALPKLLSLLAMFVYKHYKYVQRCWIYRYLEKKGATSITERRGYRKLWLFIMPDTSHTDIHIYKSVETLSQVPLHRLFEAL